MVETALEGAPTIFAHSDAFGRHEDYLTVLAQRLNFCGLPFLLEVAFFLLCSANDLTFSAAALKLRSLFCQGSLNSFLAPALRRIPASGQVGLATSTADPNLIEGLPIFGCSFSG